MTDKQTRINLSIKLKGGMSFTASEALPPLLFLPDASLRPAPDKGTRLT